MSIYAAIITTDFISSGGVVEGRFEFVNRYASGYHLIEDSRPFAMYLGHMLDCVLEVVAVRVYQAEST